MATGLPLAVLRQSLCGIAVVALCALLLRPAWAEQAVPDTPEDDPEERLEAILPAPEVWIGDFDGIRERRQLRILVPYSKTFFFIDRGTQRGTDVDFGLALEKWINKKYTKPRGTGIRVVFIPTRRDRLIPALLEGLGDIAAGNLTVTERRRQRVDFTIPWITGVREVLVTGPAAPVVTRLEDLAGKEIRVRYSSSYYDHLLQLNEKLASLGLPAIVLSPADEDLEDEDLLEMVEVGLLPWAIVDDHKAKLWVQVFERIVAREDIAVHEGGDIAWAVRPGSRLLLAELDPFLEKHRLRTSLGNQIFRRYLQSTEFVKNATSVEDMERFERVVELFQKYGEDYGFDYLMLLAQGYQESGLDQSMRSPRGAVGIMQLLPKTAASDPINIRDVAADPESNIHAGAKYMRHLVDTYRDDPALDDKNRTLMAFAAYNAGPGNLRKFRRLAEKSGLDPNVWFHNVELGAAKIVGQETVRYVANIYKYYVAYKLATERQAERAVERDRAKATLDDVPQ
jgi:membrane-bound lytic murein transglycosylase MltF